MDHDETTAPAAPPGLLPRPAVGTEHPGDAIGPYRLLEVLGEGGFGTVWLAERREPFVQRVALKIIKAGMDTRAVIARFEQERQALAVPPALRRWSRRRDHRCLMPPFRLWRR